jgi:carboxylesterase type B
MVLTRTAGESAGGGSIIHHLTAYRGKRGRAAFKQAIVQSPGWDPDIDRQTTTASVMSAASNLTGETITTVEGLRSLNSTTLQSINRMIHWSAFFGTVPFGPWADGHLVPEAPRQLLQKLHFDDTVTV